MKKIVCFGPGPMFKGGISNYNTSLAKALEKQGAQVHIVSWTHQYPAIIPRDFVDKSSRVDVLSGTNIKVTYITNYNNPFSWEKTFRFIISLQPDMVIFQWAIALQGLPLGYIAKRLSKHRNIEVIFDLHVVKQKESSKLDNAFVKYGLKHACTYIAHSYQTANELKQLFPEQDFHVNETGIRATDKKTIIKLYHPVYDMFQPDPHFNKEHEKQKMGLKKNVFLFFGFIRKYKGLHNVIMAFAELCKRRNDVSLLIAGESFWQTLDKNRLSTRIKNLLFGTAKKIFLKNSDNEQDYKPLDLIDQLGITENVVVFNQFIPNEEIYRFFQVADCVVNYYLTATPSGVESIAYNFHLPILATRVGHFPETVIPGYNGYLAEPDNIKSMADTMEYFIEHPIDRRYVAEIASKFSWENYAKALLHQ
jgi:glycosyltransferase involved in cell wall biosynthesis